MGSLGPTGLVQSATIARRFYVEDRTKVEIAAEFGLSRFRVARILDAALRDGIVKIEIVTPAEIDVQRSAALAAGYGLRHAVVVDTPEQPSQLARRHLGRVGASVLTEIVTEGETLGIAWGRSLAALATELRALARCSVVQLCGALVRDESEESSVELSRRVAKVSGGTVYPLYAPLVMPDARAAAALRREPQVAATLQRFNQITTAVVAVGGWAPGSSTVYDSLSQGERVAIAGRGAVAEISGNLLDCQGRPIDSELRRRIIGITVDQLRRVPQVMALTYGSAKVGAVRSALASGLIHTLVTDAALAEGLLSGQDP